MSINHYLFLLNSYQLRVCIIVYLHKLMLQDKLPELIRTTYNLKVLVTASYKAKQSLAAKGLTPAVFLDPFYRDKTQGIQQVCFNFKEKQIKPLPDFITIDLDDYTLIRKQSKDPMQDIDEQLLSKKLYEMLCDQKIKYLRQIDKNVFQDQSRIEKFINNQSFHWFERSNRMYFTALTMGQQNYRINTSDQPIGLCFVLEVQKQKSVKEIFDKLKNDVDFLIRRIFQLNPDQISNLKTMVIILFDVSNQATVQQAIDYTGYFKQNTNIHPSLIFRLAINGQDLADSNQWSQFDRPIFHFNYNIKGSDPLRIIGQDEFKKIQQIVTHHKQAMRKYLEYRLEQLSKKYEDVNKTTKIIANFFRGNTPSDRTYTKQEMDMRQLADKLFIVEDYKRAYEIYKNLINKMEKRNSNIENNLSEMIQLCLAISKFHNIKLKSEPYNQIEKYGQRIIKFYENKSKLRLKKYLIFLVYVFHSFKTFERQFIRGTFYSSVKLTFTQSNIFVNIIPTLIYEQFANMNLFYKNIDYRRYCYDLTRVASRFSEIKMYQYALRCFLIVQSLYRETFSNIQKYQFTQLSHLFLQAKNYKQSLRNLKSAWEVYANRMQSEDLQKNQSQLTKVIQNYNKMIRQIQKLAPNELSQLVYPNLRIPIIHSLNLQTKDEILEFDQKSGIKWQQIGEGVLENKDMMSAGLNQKQFRNLFKAFDFGVPEQKYLIYRFNGSNLSQMIIKKNSRYAYVGEPIKLTFYMRNPLRGDIDVQNINIRLKQTLQNFLIKTETNTVSIKGFKSCQIMFEIIPKQPGFLQIHRIQWVFMKLLSEYSIKQPGQIKSNEKSCYFKLNINPAVGCLESKATFEDYYYEGERTRMKILFKNAGTQNVSKIYVAVGDEEMFGFKMKQLNICLEPQQQKEVSFNIFIPLVHDSIQSGQQKKICKVLILYKTLDRFRVSRTINKFNIIRIAKIQNLTCQRLSTHLHLLSFSKKKSSKEDVCALEWMIIPGGYQIVKKEAADLALSTNYFFFIRKGNFSMAKFQFQNKAKDLSLYPEQFLKISLEQDKISIRFLWRIQQKIGYISKYNIPILINEHGYLSTIFPISFKINYQKQVSHNFRKQPFMQIPVSIKLKNVMYNDQLKTTVYFIDNSENDATWQGTTEKKMLLKMGSQSIIDIKYIVVRPGIYILSNEIKYSITNSKSQNINITHSQYEKIYLTVKEEKSDENTNKIFFQDAFKEFEPSINKKNVELKKETDSLI